MIKIEEEKQVSLEEWDTIWNMFVAKKLEESEEEIKEIENSQIKIVIANNQQEGRFNPNGKVYMRQQRSDSVLVPRSTVHKHCNPWRILGVSSIYFRKDKILKFEIPIVKQKTTNNVRDDRTKIQKGFFMKDKKLLRECADTYPIKETTKERTIDWCEEYKLNRLILLNYTERGKKLRKIGKLP